MTATQEAPRRSSDLQILRRYTDQPERLPTELRQRVESDWGGEPVQLYAMTDLDPALRLTRTWWALGPTR